MSDKPQDIAGEQAEQGAARNAFEGLTGQDSTAAEPAGTARAGQGDA